MDILIYSLQFIVGLAAIVKGADWLTDGAASIARKFGIPTLVVGLTIVAMGSSAPELVVSVVSAIQGNADIALGNVVGSNIFNTLAIMGVTAMVCPIVVERGNIRNDVPFSVLASVAVFITAFDSLFNGRLTNAVGTDTIIQQNIISRTDGLLLLCMFAIFMSYTMSIAKRGDGTPTAEGPAADNGKDITEMPTWKCVAWIVTGLAGLIFGGNWLVGGASGLALMMGVSQSIIALTIVSMGTSAPELAASVMAARKSDTAMALGNVVGSNVFNVFFVLGCAATIHPLGIGGITLFDITTLLVASATLWLLCKFGKTYYTLTRLEGALLVIMAVAYYGIIVYNA